MRVIKNINNNVSVCLDDNQNEVVVFGKGVGFIKPPYEIEESKIQKMYYGINDTYISMINAISGEILDVSADIIGYAQEKLQNPINPNCVITLADHIQFAIKRYTKNIEIDLPIINDIKHLYAVEMDIGEFGLELINKKLQLDLPQEEAAYIALHILNAEMMDDKSKREKNATDVINEIIEIIENEFDFKVDKKSFDYSRFVSHMHYLLKRVKENKLIEEKNGKLYAALRDDWQQIYTCCEKICSYLKDNMEKELTDEERLYLMLHIDRLLGKEKDE